MSGLWVRLFVVGAFFAIASQSLAHDSWISRGALRNAAGEWCCGEGDCFVIPSKQVSITPTGYHLPNGETVPFVLNGDSAASFGVSRRSMPVLVLVVGTVIIGLPRARTRQGDGLDTAPN